MGEMVLIYRMNPMLLWGRVLMADSLAFHIFALFGVGVPLLVCVAELIGIRCRDADFAQVARRWTFAMTIMFVVGAISGTVVAVEFFMLWPGFVAFAGPAIGLPMFLEVFAFFIEAIFSRHLYIYLGPLGEMVMAALALLFACRHRLFRFGLLLITTVNAFMNDPAGITTATVNGVLKITDVVPWRAMFGPATLTETSHSILAYYATTFFAAAAVYALAILRRRKRHRQ